VITLPTHVFWFLLVWTCVLWYACLIVYIGRKGAQDIRSRLSSLRKPPEQTTGEGSPKTTAAGQYLPKSVETSDFANMMLQVVQEYV